MPRRMYLAIGQKGGHAGTTNLWIGKLSLKDMPCQLQRRTLMPIGHVKVNITWVLKFEYDKVSIKKVDKQNIGL